MRRRSSTFEPSRRRLRVFLAFLTVAAPATTQAQTTPLAAPPSSENVTQTESEADSPPMTEAPAGPAPNATLGRVEVQPNNADELIAARLERIFSATPWFESSNVTVDEGVVSLRGRARTQSNKDWAGQVAAKTQDVVAVVNLIEVVDKSAWDFSPAWEEIRRMGRLTVRALPRCVMAALVLLGAWLAARLAARAARRASSSRVQSPLLSDVIAKGVAIPVLLVGVYLALHLCGLTGLAATLLGGTGIIGLVLGIAFRDIAENFLASILISIQRPFLPGDLIQVADHQGYVQKVTSRGTIIMTLEGNHVQVPNATIYKSIIRNFTANPNMRIDFAVSVAYQDDVSAAQDAVRRVLAAHDAVLADPEPLVLVEEFALVPPVVRLHAYVWINTRDHSGPKVRSALMRLTKNALQNEGFMMPGPVPVAPSVTATDPADPLQSGEVRLSRGSAAPQKRAGLAIHPRQAELLQQGPNVARATVSEGDLRSEKAELKAQAARSRELETGADLLNSR